MSKLRNNDAALKARVAVEAVKGERTVSELAAAHEVHPMMSHQWKQSLPEGAAGIFERGGKAAAAARIAEDRVRALHARIVGRAIDAPLMEWMAPSSGIAICQIGCCEQGPQRVLSTEEIPTIGVDLAKSVFQLHGVDAKGRPLLRRQLRRSQIPRFFQHRPECLIGMEACANAHCRARELSESGHDVLLMQPGCVKGYVKCGTTDKADAICEAVSRPSMRFVRVKSEDRACSASGTAMPRLMR
jgi:transposase-like protein